MPNGISRAICLALGSCSVAACSTVQSAQRQAVRYNSAFSNARNEILLLNVLRAKNGEPLQFSTISTVTGSMRGNISITTGLEAVFGGDDKLTPGGGFTFRDPSVTLTPLDSKEFRQGMMNAVNAGYYAELLRQGWDYEVVRNLVVANLSCVSVNDQKSSVRVWVSGADAAEMLREGAGKGTKLEIIPSSAKGDDKVLLQFTTERSSPEVAEVSSTVCPTGAMNPKVSRFRSPLEMINYLGRHASDSYDYLRLKSAPRRVPEPALVATAYGGYMYYIDDGDRKSAQTLALLAEIIGFQTTNAELNASKPAITLSTE